jgi:hypothetical protein
MPTEGEMSARQLPLGPARPRPAWSAPGWLVRDLRRLAALGLACAAPALVYVFMTHTPAPGTPHLFDFHTFWQAGRDYAHGRDPYPKRIAGSIGRADSFVYPAPVAAAMVPLGLLPYAIAWIVFGIVLIAALVASFWLVGVRDWRCYALAFCALPVLKALNLGSVTPLLLLGAAATWRFRERGGVLALVVAATVVTKLFLWPILPWLWFTGRRRAAVQAFAVAVVVTTVAWLPLGFASIERYPSLLHQLSMVEGWAGYGVGGLATALGTSHGIAATLPTLLAPLAVVTAWAAARVLPDSRSLAVVIAAAIAISPVVWEHYFALGLICVALVSRTLSVAWLLPLAYWLTPSQQAWGSLWRTALALVVLAACALASHAEALHVIRGAAADGVPRTWLTRVSPRKGESIPASRNAN